jgi:hypothetical protein
MGNFVSSLECLVRKALLVSGVVVPLCFFGCKKLDDPVVEPPLDVVSPLFSISSPLEQKVYDVPIVTIAGTIVEDNLKVAWYSLDNEKTKVSIGKNFSESVTLTNGDYVAIFYAEDYRNPSTKKNVSFSVNKIFDTIPPKITISSPINNKVYDVNEIVFSWSIDEANFKSAWYTVDGGSKVSIAKSGSESKTFANGTHEIVLGADDLSGNKSIDSKIFTADKHTWKYFVNPFVQPDSTTKPIIWNNYTTPAQRNARIDDRLYNYDKTDTIKAIPDVFVCSDFATILAINFNGYQCILQHWKYLDSHFIR